MDHPTFESDFTDLAKGMPDLERIISRIHAKNCKVKDFLKVLSVSVIFEQCIQNAPETCSLVVRETQRRDGKSFGDGGILQFSISRWIVAICSRRASKREEHQEDVPHARQRRKG